MEPASRPLSPTERHERLNKTSRGVRNPIRSSRGRGRSTLADDMSLQHEKMAMSIRAEVDQSPSDFLQHVHDMVPERLDAAFVRFLTGGKSTKKLLALVQPTDTKHRPEMDKDFDVEYELDDVRELRTVSATSPVLRFARVGRSILTGLIDFNTRVVIKCYPNIVGLLEQSKAGDLSARFTLVQIANDIILGATVVNGFVDGFAHVITPHFAYRLDWFLGPSLKGVRERPFTPDSDETGNPSTRRYYDYSQLSQYVIEERVDTTLLAMIDATTSPITMELYGDAWNLCSFRALLAQGLFSLEAAWETTRFLHLDLVCSNWMVRGLLKERRSPYRNTTLVYKRAPAIGRRARRTVMALGADEHANLFTEIIDFGRSRAVVPVPDGNGFVTVSNEYVPRGANDAPIDASYDLRVFAWSMINARFDVGMLAIMTRVAFAGNDLSFVGDLLEKTMHAIVVMSNMTRAIPLMVRIINRMAPAAGSPLANFHTHLHEIQRLYFTADMAKPTFVETERKRAFNIYQAYMRAMSTMSPNAYTEFFDGYFGFGTAMKEDDFFFSDTAPAELNGAHPLVSPTYCLDKLPLFSELFAYGSKLMEDTGGKRFVVVGEVSASDVLFDSH